jgi:alginate O-acetyltransferase complex protein AlgI
VQFDSWLYVWFLAAVFVLAWAVWRRPGLRMLILLVASYLFYASWNVSLLGLIVFSTLVDFGVGLALSRAERPAWRTLWLLVSLTSNLGLLALFKYADFFATSLEALAVLAGQPVDLPTLDLVLPVGISFYTFQTLSYTIDVYRRRLAPTRNLFQFATFVAFFPQLVAGPIVRASELLPQLARTPRFDTAAHALGLFWIVAGLIKKVCIADVIGANLVDRVFENPGAFSAVENLAACYGYTVQIYCDFSGYSDVAIGSALLLGFRLPENFDRPFQATTLQHFWRRWHKSLSFWLRDYLYIPLGGSRRGPLLTYVNLFLTMLLGGLWHGNTWNFVVWGALHGLGLALTRWVQRRLEARWPALQFRGPGGRLLQLLGVVTTFHFVVITFVVFRATDLTNALHVLDRAGAWDLSAGALQAWGASLGRGDLGPNLPGWLALLVLGALAWHWTPRRWWLGLAEAWPRLPVAVQVPVLVACAVLLDQVAGAGARPFIYFQF